VPPAARALVLTGEESLEAFAGLLGDWEAAALRQRLGLPGRPVAPAPSAPGPARRLPATLTDEERAVVRLVVEGKKNQAIASELFVSRRTVEMRLTSIYRKTAVASRYELIRSLTGSQGTPP
jgi:DNA-binding NarL/FixJ family response regulator